MLMSKNKMVKSISLKRSIMIVMAVVFFMSLVFTASPVQAQNWQEFSESSGNFYNYCPSYIQTDSNTRYIFYCRNKDSGVILDQVYWRKATKNGTSWSWGEQQIAISPSSSGWDNVHVCDPDVKKANITYNGHTYSWVMFYLGCDRYDCKHNQIGLAFADSIEGPWIKYSNNPVIQSSSTTTWGVGQTSATSVDANGRFLLFYTAEIDSSGFYVGRRDINIGNMSSPSFGTEYKLFSNGLTEQDGSTPFINNIAVAYDAGTDRIYMVRERFPRPSGDPDFISAELQVAYTSATNIWNNSGTWTVDGHINQSNSGKARNHNACFLTSESGGLIGGAGGYQVEYTGSNTGTDNLWTYRLYGIMKGDLNDGTSGNGVVSGKIYKLVNQKTGNVLDNYGMNNGDGCYTWDWTGVSNQQWQIVDVGSGYYKLINQRSNKALDCYDNSNPSAVYVWDYVSGVDQQWKIESVGNGYVKILNRKSNKALDSYNDVNGDSVYGWDYVSGADQHWQLVQLN